MTSTACVHKTFEQQAARTPERIALSQNGRTLSYRQLNERANQIAHYLRRLGVTSEEFVGLCMERTPDLVAALIGILKAGGTYVPIDPQYPRERLAFMLQDSKARVILTEQALAPDLRLAGTQIVFMDRDWTSIADEPNSNLDVPVDPAQLAYVIYTSGSTGQPKGTMISHANVARLFAATQPWFSFSQEDVWTLFHSCAFDFSVWEIWGALLYGGKLVVVSFGASRTPDSFYQLLAEEKVTVLNQTPSAFKQLIHAEESLGRSSDLALRWVIFGGEALDFSSLKPWFERHGDQKPTLVNMYGITETTVHVTFRLIRANDVASSSVLGVAIPDLQLHLLDEHGVAVAAGVTGEIHVGGAGVARGYLNRPELTAQKFIVHPLAQAPGRLYRSGDLGRYLPNGELEYLGRMDHQVKLRGFRIELGEIMAVLNSHEAVRESVVIVSESVAGEKILAAYLVLKPGQNAPESTLRQLLRERVPEYMVPSAFVFMDRLPLTVNGKLDTGALPPPAAQRPATVAIPTPLLAGNGSEKAIAAIWCEVLQLKAVSVEQNFFDVGGNSMNLVEVHEKLQSLLGRDVAITDLFAHSTVRGLAAHLSPTKPLVAVSNPSANRADRQREALLALRNSRRERR